MLSYKDCNLRLKLIYGDTEALLKQLQDIENTSDADLSKIYQQICTKSQNINKLMKNCHSDLTYWGYMGDFERLEVLKRYVEQRMINVLCINDCKDMTQLKYSEKRLNGVEKRANETIIGLETYKPSYYRQKIELIRQIFKDKD